MKNCGYWIYWYNPTFARTGYVEYTTISEKRAVELFRRDFDESYEIMNIHN
jgi:hypothetical protein